MNHEYFRDRVSAYFDKSLPPQEQLAMEQHVADCPECQALLEKFSKLDQLVQQKGDLSGGDYWEQAAQRIEKRLGKQEQTNVTDISRGRWYSGMKWKIAAVAASAILLIYVGYHEHEIYRPRPLEAPSLPSVSNPPTETLSGGASQKPADATKPVQKDEELSQKRDQLQPSENYKQSTKDRIAVKRAENEVRAKTETGGKQEMPAPQPSSKVALPPPATAAIQQSSKAPQVVSDSMVAGYKSVTEDLSMSADAQSAVVKAKAAPQAVSMADNALKRGVVPDDSTAEQLGSLRKTRDSLLALGPSTETSTTAKLNMPSISQGLVKGQAKPRASRKDDRELKLIQTCYSIATLTKDTTEYNQVVGIIEKTAADSSSAYQSVAASYLSRLKRP